MPAATSSVTFTRTIVHRSIEAGSRPARRAPACTWATASFTSVGSRPTLTITPSAISPASSVTRGHLACRPSDSGLEIARNERGHPAHRHGDCGSAVGSASRARPAWADGELGGVGSRPSSPGSGSRRRPRRPGQMGHEPLATQGRRSWRRGVAGRRQRGQASTSGPKARCMTRPGPGRVGARRGQATLRAPRRRPRRGGRAKRTTRDRQAACGASTPG